jgi:PadR family transcriptional regulator, regulatory protein PadR
MRLERELMRGAGPLAVLRLLESGEKYGYELIQQLDKQTNGVLAMGQSTLYPLLYNLQAKGLVASRVMAAESGKSRKYYRLTTKGVRHLEKSRQQWATMSQAMAGLGIAGA